MRFINGIRAAMIACAAVAMASAHADGYTWEKIDGSMTAYVTVGPATQSFTYKSTGFLFNNNTLNPITSSVDSLYLKLQTQLYNTILAAAQAEIPQQYRSHVVSVSGPISLDIQGTNGSYANVSFTGPSASVTMNLAGKVSGINYSCNVMVTSGVISGSDGRLDVVSGSLSGLAISAAAPTHSETCSTSLGWIPFIGTLVDNFATSKVSNYLDGMINTLQAANNELKPLQFMGLNQALAGLTWPVGSKSNAAGFLVDNLWNAFQTASVSVMVAERPSPGAYVNKDRLRIAFSIGGESIALRINEYASYRMKQNPCTPACIPT